MVFMKKKNHPLMIIAKKSTKLIAFEYCSAVLVVWALFKPRYKNSNKTFLLAFPRNRPMFTFLKNIEKCLDSDIVR